MRKHNPNNKEIDMKRLSIFLCGILLLASCEEIEEAHTLPQDFSIGEIRDISELTYDELERLGANAYDSYRAEEMRRRGGLVVAGAVNAGSSDHYDNVSLLYASRESDLPATGSGYYGDGVSVMWDNELISNDSSRPMFFISNEALRSTASGNSGSLYFKLRLSAWDATYPGYLDNCLQGDYYSIYAYSSAKAYERTEKPYITDCTVDAGSGIIVANFYMYSNYPVTRCGLCYSRTNQLPDLSDEVAVADSSEYAGSTDTHLSVYGNPREGGSYYVRAFAASEKGTAYSPVWQVETEGGYVDAAVDTIMDLSALGYSELESLFSEIDNSYYAEDMRRDGGLVLRASVDAYNYSFSNLRLWYAESVDGLPQGREDFWDGSFLDERSVDEKRPIFYHNYTSLPENGEFYYELQLRVDGRWSSYDTFPWTGKYTVSTAPRIYDCELAYYSASFSIQSATTVTSRGVCYSATNELPTVNDQTVTQVEQDNQNKNYIYFTEGTVEPGTYYMRAFAVSANGTGYSPVQRVTIN